ncbi:class F sortase [Pseudonocardia acidicola]|uniref:Class F sortase n=1 Tax=Pseudonocardia acidicola TaxID=2724939 RepID=A0ABX1S887_9PSEU|nr:class F sortase [Pseudonocardia acidicola]NMH97124.1 class F sortase [Pseudonocardia acidicola]
MLSRRRWPAVLVALCGAACLVTGVVLWSAGRSGAVEATDLGTAAMGQAGPGPGPAMAAAGPAVPDSTAPHPPASVAVPPGSVPVGLSLPERGITAPVVPIGTDPGGALQPPDPPQTVGWWAPGALAGAPTGTVVIAGHVDSAVAGIGVLAVLPSLTAGEPISLRGADGRTFTYRVQARHQFAKARLPAEVFAQTASPRLVLVTCGGRFDPVLRSYDDNIVVYAVPADPS